MDKGILARVAFVACALFALPALRAIGAEDYPSRPVTIVVPFPPGASNDLLARYEADVLSRALHGSFVVENKTGAGGDIGISFAAKANPDGYTLLHAPSVITLLPFVMKSVSYDLAKDFTARHPRRPDQILPGGLAVAAGQLGGGSDRACQGASPTR